MSKKQKTEPLSGDTAFIASLNEITTPLGALQAMLNHSMYMNGDPYYSDLSDALWSMAERVATQSGAELTGR